jgi:hypothetical protein
VDSRGARPGLRSVAFEQHPRSRPGYSLQYIERYKQAFGRPGAATALINYYRGAVDLASRYPAPALQAALRRPLRVPTLLLWGERDTALGQQAREGSLSLPGCCCRTTAASLGQACSLFRCPHHAPCDTVLSAVCAPSIPLLLLKGTEICCLCPLHTAAAAERH